MTVLLLITMKSLLRVVLCYPQIPPNTGCIARTCAATQTALHLVEPLGFDISDKSLKRAGIDYWSSVDISIHPSFDEFQSKRARGRLIAFSPRGTVPYQSFKYQPGDYLIHGAELEGLPDSILECADSVAYIPITSTSVRSLNLAVSASLSLYEALRQLNIT